MQSRSVNDVDSIDNTELRESINDDEIKKNLLEEDKKPRNRKIGYK